MATHKAQFWARALGASVAVLSLFFMAALLWSQRKTLTDYHPQSSDVAILLIGCFAYAGAGFLLTRAWRSLLSWAGEGGFDPHESRRIYATTQLAKYVPGNVVQLLSRHAIGRQAGWSHAGLLLASVFEILSLLCVAALVGVVGLAFTGIEVGALSIPALLALLAGLVVLGVLLLRAGASMLAPRWPEVAARFQEARVADLWPVVLLHGGFFLVGGLILLGVTHVVLGTAVSLEYWPALIGLFAAGWIAGMITPGAPSGIGVRETVLVLGLSIVTPVAAAVLIAGILRLLTVGGDLLFFLFNAIKRKGAKQES